MYAPVVATHEATCPRHRLFTALSYSAAAGCCTYQRHTFSVNPRSKQDYSRAQDSVCNESHSSVNTGVGIAGKKRWNHCFAGILIQVMIFAESIFWFRIARIACSLCIFLASSYFLFFLFLTHAAFFVSHSCHFQSRRRERRELCSRSIGLDTRSYSFQVFFGQSFLLCQPKIRVV